MHYPNYIFHYFVINLHVRSGNIGKQERNDKSPSTPLWGKSGGDDGHEGATGKN